MAWEWVYQSNPPRWVLTVGEWHAVVQRGAGKDYGWIPWVERTTAPLNRYDGPKSNDPMTARAWCLTKIAELRTARP